MTPRSPAGGVRGAAAGPAGALPAARPVAAADAASAGASSTPFGRLAANRLALASVVFLLVLVTAALLAPWIAPYPYDLTDLPYGPRPPSAAHWFGTDELGRDLFTRVLYGARISLAVGVAATLVSLTIGVSYGAIAGYAGGRADQVMMRVVDTLYGLPFIFFVIILMVIAGRNIVNLFLALGAVEWLTLARITRGEVLALKQRPFVEGARALGAGPARLVGRHLLPNGLAPIIVYTTLKVPDVMLDEAFLSFLGLGVQPPMASWGSLAAEGAAAMEAYPWLILFPGLALALTLLALNFLGDGLRDALDPMESGGGLRFVSRGSSAPLLTTSAPRGVRFRGSAPDPSESGGLLQSPPDNPRTSRAQAGGAGPTLPGRRSAPSGAVVRPGADTPCEGSPRVPDGISPRWSGSGSVWKRERHRKP